MFDDDFLDGEFEGGVFSKEIDGGRAGASIRMDDRGLIALLSDGEQFFLSYGECDLEIGGASGRMVFCRNADRSLTIFCEDKKFPAALEQASAGELMERLEEINATGRRRSLAGKIGFWGFLVGCALLLVGGWYGIVWGARAAVVHVPFSVDEQLGEAVYEQALAEVAQMTGEDEVTLIEDDAVRLPLQKLVDDLAVHSRMPEVKFQVLVCDTEIPNAVALPGGRMIVFRGLIDLVETPEELLAVLAHEMSHVTLRHHLQSIGESIGVIVALEILIGDVGGLVALGAEALHAAALMNKSREHEHEADLEGVRMLHKAGIDPGHAISMLEALPHGEIPDAHDWLSSHPDIEERVAAIRKLVEKLPPQEYSPLDFDLEGLRAAMRNRDVPADVAPEDKDGDKDIENAAAAAPEKEKLEEALAK
jgi:Zn-dependent protease with chaperone function